MKVCLYSKYQKLIEKSGVGRAIYHQQKALEEVGISCVTNPEAADVIHINTVFPDSVRLAKWAKRQGKIVIFHAHSTKEDFRNSYIGSNVCAGLFGKWIKYCYSLGDCIITPTSYSRKLLLSYGIKKPIFSLSNGIDVDYYQAQPEAGMRFRKKYGYSEDAKIVMSVGLWIERKGILDFIKMAKEMPEYQFIWFGESDIYTLPKNIRKALKTKLQNLRFAGYVDKEALRDAYAGCDLFLFPSYEETEGIVVLEALAMKIPVLLRDIPVYDGWITDGKNAYKACNVQDFKEKCRQIIEQELPDLTAEGYTTAEARSIDKIGQKIKKVYLYAEKLRLVYKSIF